jgi:hypothetical protein
MKLKLIAAAAQDVMVLALASGADADPVGCGKGAAKALIGGLAWVL